jgi:hypothetical protein
LDVDNVLLDVIKILHKTGEILPHEGVMLENSPLPLDKFFEDYHSLCELGIVYSIVNILEALPHF